MSKTGVELIAQERQKHQEKGYTIENDVVRNNAFQLRDYAVSLIRPAGMRASYPSHWDQEYCKKVDKESYANRLVKAGAAIAAELDRLHANGEVPTAE